MSGMEIESDLGIINRIIPKSNIYNDALVCGISWNCNILNELSILLIKNITFVFSLPSLHTGPSHICESRKLIGILHIYLLLYKSIALISLAVLHEIKMKIDF